ncbi:2-dehydropantoate 2-reductase [Hahella sp. SMD15-11]|uniref:2-dehydropantoate 2-reductase n=1 Tax=Thermohahella caldifontis TaxID=3142973 RepID=A0AB39UYC5_9GAMM
MAHILIAGLGAMGGLWAARLAAAHTLSVLTPASDREIRDGHIHLTLHELSGTTRTVTLPLRHDRESRPDVVLLTCKTWQTHDVLAQLAPILSENVPLVILQNGMGTQDRLSGLSRPVLAASTTEAAWREERRTLHHAATGTTLIGGLNAAGDACLDTVCGWLSASGLDIRPTEAIRTVLWDKLCVNCGINPFTALLRVRNGEILDSDLYRQSIEPLTRELALARQLAGTPLSADEIRTRIESVARRTAGNRSSMLQDVLAGRPTEIDAMNGFVAQFLESRNQNAPVNRLLTDRIHQLKTG